MTTATRQDEVKKGDRVVLTPIGRYECFLDNSSSAVFGTVTRIYKNGLIQVHRDGELKLNRYARSWWQKVELPAQPNG